MGNQSIVSGYISIFGGESSIEETRQAIATHPFDRVWPFTNIFWCDSPAQYDGAVVVFGGSYNQVEEVWNDWLWRFSQLLTGLDGWDARVTLDCILGVYTWRLWPKRRYKWSEWVKQGQIGRPQYLSGSMIGEEWGIIEAPENDFSTDAEWLAKYQQDEGWGKQANRWEPLT